MGQKWQEPHWRPSGGLHTWSSALLPGQEAPSSQPHPRMRPAPALAPASRLWRKVELQWFPGMQGCGALCFGSTSARYSPSLPVAAPQWASPAPTHSLLPHPILCTQLPQTRAGGGDAKPEPLCLPLPSSWAQEGLMVNNTSGLTWA